MRRMELVLIEQVSKGEWITTELQGDTTDPLEQDWWRVVTLPVRGQVAVTMYDGSPLIVGAAAVWRLTEDDQPVIDEGTDR